MLLVELKCQRCGHRIEATVIDRDNPKERRDSGTPVRCPECHSTLLERVRVIQCMASEAGVVRERRTI